MHFSLKTRLWLWEIFHFWDLGVAKNGGLTLVFGFVESEFDCFAFGDFSKFFFGVGGFG